jgi:hypothetical protein
VLIGLLVLSGLAIAFVYAQVNIAIKSIQFDLRTIGKSVYEARAKKGKWPARIEDLDGTEYLRLPYRKAMLEQRAFVVVVQQDLDPNPEENRGRVLAYDNSSLLSRFGRVWVCGGDLHIEYMDADELNGLLKVVQTN